MARQVFGDAPASFNSKVKTGGTRFPYDIQLITPMAGGGARSWRPDLDHPVRGQAIKGQLRFWWRTLQHATTPSALREKEDQLWGTTDTASRVRLRVRLTTPVDHRNVLTITPSEKGYLRFDYAGLPGYVLFPLQGQKDMVDHQLLTGIRFRLEVDCSDANITREVDRAVKLWLLFGGLGARTRRGCGSLYCKAVMDEFSSGKDIDAFIRKAAHPDAPAFGQSPYPVLGNCRLAWDVSTSPVDPATVWSRYLDEYGRFRQGPNCGRNPGKGNQPGRSRWPEADAIRRITGQNSKEHAPVHDAGNWFPRGAYGMPIQTEFKNAPGDPRGKFFLSPVGGERWPSPVFLKVVKLNNTTVARICLILNHQIPEQIDLDLGYRLHRLSLQEHPMQFKKKKMPKNAAMLHSGENPYDALIRHFNLTEAD